MAQELDLAPLSAFLESRIDGFAPLISSQKFASGQSNPTYLLKTKNDQFVLRTKPEGVLLKSAHAVDREFRVMSALAKSDVPVPEMIFYTDEENPLGRAFFLMSKVEGEINWDPALPDKTKAERTKIYSEMADKLAKLHSLDPTEIGLADFGRAGNYFERQTGRWIKQYEASCDKVDADVNFSTQWLLANMVSDDGASTLVHGDYRLDNMIFDKACNVVALLDWELSTLGHPLADLAYQCMQWRMPNNSPLRGLGGIDRADLGIPTEAEYVQQYTKLRGIEPIENWNFYIVFSFFRLVAILQGVAHRAKEGNASNPQKAVEYGKAIPDLITLMRRAISEG